MNNRLRIATWIFCIVAVITLSLYLSSVTYYILNGLNPDDALPWSILGYIQYWSEPFGTRLAISFIAPNFLIAIATGLLFFKPKSTESRWATSADIRKAGMFKTSGLILGQTRSKYLINNDPAHSLVVAPTGSGKGVGLVIPNLLAWPGTFICLDVKGENHRFTSGYRASLKHKVINFSPFAQDQCSHCYNPLDYVSENKNRRITDLQVIASILITVSSKADPHFPEEARDLFVGLALYVIDEKAYPSTIGALFRLLGSEDELKDILRHVARTHPELDEAARQLFNSYANKAEKERSGIKSTLGRALMLWRNPVIDAVTSKSDFSFYDLRKTRHAIYIGVSVNEMKTLSPLMRLFFEQAITVLSANEPDPETEPCKVLMLLDELHLLGNMDVMANAFTLLRSFNVRIMGIIQNLEALAIPYEKAVWETIISNCAHQIFFAASGSRQTKRYVSEECGQHKVKSKTVSRGRGLKYEAPKVSISEKWEPLIKEHEIGLLGEDEELILVEKYHPIRCKKINYRFDKTFQSLLREAVPTPPLDIKQARAPKFDIPINIKGNNSDEFRNPINFNYKS